MKVNEIYLLNTIYLVFFCFNNFFYFDHKTFDYYKVNQNFFLYIIAHFLPMIIYFKNVLSLLSLLNMNLYSQLAKYYLIFFNISR